MDSLTLDIAALLWVRVYFGPDPERMVSRFGYPILSSSSSTALPTFSSRQVSATLRFGLATYQASAVCWFLTIQSLIPGLRIPGHPSQLQNRMSIEFGIFVTKSSM